MKQLKITKFPELDYAGSEAFNTLSTNLSFAGETVKKIMITSCHASEGKSYLAMNLMRTRRRPLPLPTSTPRWAAATFPTR